MGQNGSTAIAFGNTGSGKSHLLNQLAGISNPEKASKLFFQVGHSITSQTGEFQKENCYLYGDKKRPITLIDSPGFQDNTGKTKLDLFKAFLQFLEENKGLKFNTILFCLKLDTRIQDNELETLNQLVDMIGIDKVNSVSIAVTQAGVFGEREKAKRIQLYQTELPALLKKRVKGWNNNNPIFIPDEKGVVPLELSSSFRETFEFRLTDMLLTSSLKIVPNMKILLNIAKEEAEKRVRDETGDKAENKEKIGLIDLLFNCEKDRIKTIFECFNKSPSKLLKTLFIYFASDDIYEKDTLINDIYTTLKVFNEKDKEGDTRFSKPNYIKALEKEVTQNLIPKMEATLNKIMEREIKEYIGSRKYLNPDLDLAILGLSSGLVAGGLGAYVASQIGVVTLFAAEGGTLSWGIPAGYAIATEGVGASVVGTFAFASAATVASVAVVAAAATYGIVSICWSREGQMKDCAKDMAKKIYQEEIKKDGLISSLVQKALFVYLLF